MTNRPARQIRTLLAGCVSVALAAGLLVVTSAPASATASEEFAYGWGSNRYGQLGNTTNSGLSAANDAPSAVSGDLTFMSISTGLEHTCGLTSTGAAYCWGNNYYGQVGNPTNTRSYDPNSAPLPVSGGLTFTSISSGGYHTCGLTSAGAAYCWGYNSDGQLGNSTNSGTYDSNNAPLPVSGGLTFSSISAGLYHTCGLTSAGAGYCWGSNYVGSLGNPTNSRVNTANSTPLAVSGGLTFTSISTGAFQSCGLTSAGAAYCWGGNYYGQLGNPTNSGTENPNNAPLTVSGGLTFSALVAGYMHTCGLTSAGAAYCWGQNQGGQLGNATNSGVNAANNAPLAVSGGLTFTSITGGQEHTCGLTSAGAAYCWGNNDAGQLGNTTNSGVSTANNTPLAVSGGLTFTSISAWGKQTFALSGTPGGGGSTTDGDSTTGTQTRPRTYTFTFLTSTGGECFTWTVRRGSVVLPGGEVACTPEGTELVGWTIPGQGRAFSDGGTVIATADQTFTAVAKNPQILVTYDVNVGYTSPGSGVLAPCLADGANIATISGRSPTLAVARDGNLDAAPACVPVGARFVGWSDQPTVDVSNRGATGVEVYRNGSSVPAEWSADPDVVNAIRLYAIWE